MGRKNAAYETLKWLLRKREVKIKAAIIGKDNAQKLRGLLKLKKIPIENRDQIEKKIKKGSLKADLGLSVLYREKIRAPIINNCKLGVINFHPAPLPDYKGNAGYNIAILKNLKEWAACAHYVDENFDTGPIIKNQKFKINAFEETAFSLEKKTSQQIVRLFCDILSRLIANPRKLSTKRNTGGIYISRQQMERMKKILPSDNIDQKIRAFWFPPYSGAYISLKGKNYTLVNDFILRSMAGSYLKVGDSSYTRSVSEA